jgi:hypothetical protein
MLSREIMGALALAILWVNTLLIAAAGAKQIASLRARRAVLAGMVRGRVVRGNGPDGVFAAHRIEQVGRAGADAASILFHDRSAEGEVFGGAIALDGGGEREVRASAPAEVWLTPRELCDAVACESREAFEAAYGPAAKAKGYARTVVAEMRPGATVFVADGEAVLVASMDPRALLAKKAGIGAAFIAAELVAASTCTALALYPPVFGLVSTIGGALGLAFFLLVQPAGTAVRDAMLVPSLTPVRGRWVRGA